MPADRGARVRMNSARRQAAVRRSSSPPRHRRAGRAERSGRDGRPVPDGRFAQAVWPWRSDAHGDLLEANRSGGVMNRYPLTVEARRDESLSRWLWLVKWLLLIP